MVVTYPTVGANDYADLLKVVRAAVEDSPEFYVLGWSFSGPLALMLAAEEPRRVQGVILCASFIRAPLPGLAWLRFVLVSPVVHSVRRIRRVVTMLSSYSTATMGRDKAETLARVSSGILAVRVRNIVALDARPWLRRCPRRLLYLAGSRDWVVPRRNGADVVREMPSAKLVTIDGPHLALYTNPSAGAQAIVRFIRESS